MTTIVNVILSAIIIGFAAWLSGKYPKAAGFIVALPLSTMLVLPMAHIQHQDPVKTHEFAKSILIAVPSVLLFLLPFLMAQRFALPFWQVYSVACLLLVPAFFLHRYLMNLLG